MAEREFRGYSMTGEPLYWPTREELTLSPEEDRKRYLRELDQVQRYPDGNYYLMGIGECFLFDPETGEVDLDKPLTVPEGVPID